MEIDDLPYQKIKSLLKEDHNGVSLNLRIAALFLVVYENLKELIEAKARDFFTSDWEVLDGKIVGKPNSKYGEMIKGKSVFRACIGFHLEIGAISIEDAQLIDRFSKYRNEVAHELYAILLDDSKDALDFEMLFEINKIARKIDRWWILNVEMEVDPEFHDEDIDEAEITSGRQLFLDQLIRVALKDVFESIQDT
ncbi:hypothetical protein G6L37_15840 [Agrobacterium rubi]|uniref:hypothetical protein n=1 Tax=Agrobacterium rubi TaxID=28099 RepID=UPI0015749DC4|nr:hypothetical protein [Agrobacterium rubi]NTF07516.1 hypothetical protein [Agrobacterium rubi]NTF19868.1 hypothetical protein [Agrobacterium rubi]NTF26833.1 hypothetical protein [Agrobacterium rubi]